MTDYTTCWEILNETGHPFSFRGACYSYILIGKGILLIFSQQVILVKTSNIFSKHARGWAFPCKQRLIFIAEGYTPPS